MGASGRWSSWTHHTTGPRRSEGFEDCAVGTGADGDLPTRRAMARPIKIFAFNLF